MYMHVHNVSIKTPGRSCVQIIQISIVKLVNSFAPLVVLYAHVAKPSQHG